MTRADAREAAWNWRSKLPANDKICHPIDALRLVIDPQLSAGTLSSELRRIDLKGLTSPCPVTLGSTLWRGKCDKFKVPRKESWNPVWAFYDPK